MRSSTDHSFLSSLLDFAPKQPTSKWRSICVLLLFAPWLCGCISPIPIKEVERNPAFSYEDLVLHGVDVGGVVFRPEAMEAEPAVSPVDATEPAEPVATEASPTSREESPSQAEATLKISKRYGSMLRSALRKAKVPLGAKRDLRRGTGDELLLAGLEAMRRDGVLPPDLAASITEAMYGSSRYLVWVRVEDQWTKTGAYSESQYSAEDGWEETGTTYYAKRTAVTTFSIYHPSAPDRLLHAELTSSAINDVSVDDWNTGSWVLDIVGDVITADPDPAMPSTEWVLAVAFRRFALALHQQAETDAERRGEGSP